MKATTIAFACIGVTSMAFAAGREDDLSLGGKTTSGRTETEYEYPKDVLVKSTIAWPGEVVAETAEPAGEISPRDAASARISAERALEQMRIKAGEKPGRVVKRYP